MAYPDDQALLEYINQPGLLARKMDPLAAVPTPPAIAETFREPGDLNIHQRGAIYWVPWSACRLIRLDRGEFATPTTVSGFLNVTMPCLLPFHMAGDGVVVNIKGQIVGCYKGWDVGVIRELIKELVELEEKIEQSQAGRKQVSETLHRDLGSLEINTERAIQRNVEPETIGEKHNHTIENQKLSQCLNNIDERLKRECTLSFCRHGVEALIIADPVSAYHLEQIGKTYSARWREVDGVLGSISWGK